jgi:transglutaminase-like putative cysteine protease
MDRKVKPVPPPLNGRPLRLVLLTLGCACLLHVDRTPLWVSAAVALNIIVAWRSGGQLNAPRWLRYLLTPLLMGMVIASFGTLNGVSAGSALLMSMGALKLLETRTHRDGVVVTVVALILVLSAGLDRQELWRLPLFLAVAWLALATIAAMGSVRAAASMRVALRRAGGPMLLAVPFAVLAFIFVPRLPGALWNMPGGEQAQTGLGEQMSPGGISDLAVSDAIAFRVRFDGAPPPAELRYWRGPVFHDFDGNTWRNVRGRSSAPRPPVEFISGRVGYQVTLEPLFPPWLFTLDTPESLEGRRHMQAPDGQFISLQPIGSTITYEAVSWLQTRNPGLLSTLARRRDTTLPPGRNNRTAELARRLRSEAASDADYAGRVMRYFAEGGFEYTLTPPQLDYNSIDDLLFNTRLGFCGHFASAFVTLMRAANVPARVVTGYHGGTWNPVGGYFIVRQSEAHAWAEVWLDGNGWVRFDPTSMVAPGRLQRSLSELLPATRSAASNFVQQNSWMRNLRDSWDAAGSWWRERVVKFNAAQQRGLLAKLGLGGIDYRGMMLLLLAGMAAWGGLLLFMQRPWRSLVRRPDAAGRLWLRYLALLEKRGLDIADHEGPEAIRRRAQRAWPEAADAVKEFTRDYTRLRFGRQQAGAETHALPRLRRQLRVIARATARATAAHLRR